MGALPDFTALVTRAPPSAAPGAPFPVEVRVCNTGTVAAGAEVSLRLTGGGVAAVVGQAPFMPVDEGACDTVSITARAPVAGPSGLSTLTAVVDAPLEVPELREDDNESAGLSLAVGRAPDFAVTALVAPPAVAPGAFEWFQAMVTVCNQGTEAGSVSVDLVLSSDAVIATPPDLVLPWGPTFWLAAGECQTQLTLSAVAPSALPSGTLARDMVLAAVADRLGAVAELRETNNLVTRSVRLGRAADLVVRSATFPTAVTPGSTFTVEVTVCNEGSSAGEADLTFVRSEDAVVASRLPLAPDDVLLPALGPRRFVLRPEVCERRSFAVSAPGATASFFARAVIDLGGALPEFDEGNNGSPARAVAVR